MSADRTDWRWSPCKSKIYWAKPSCPERIGNIRTEGTARTYRIGIAAPSYVRVVLLIEKRKIDGLGHCLIADVIGMHVIAAVIGG